MSTSKTRPAGDPPEQQREATMRGSTKSTIACYCPSRWLLAHHNPQANIYTMSSHMCLADLNNEGESLLALVDFKQSPITSDNDILTTSDQLPRPQKAPYDCRLRVYRGQQLIYNHFLDDMPSCLLAVSIGGPPSGSFHDSKHLERKSGNRSLLTLAINEDTYFYHKLMPSHRQTLEDEDCITETLNRSEYEAWQMVRQNKVDVEALRELLISLSNELGPQELTSHSNNFLALSSHEDREKYLLFWKYKMLNKGAGENIMGMDTICCAAARFKYTSTVTRSGDFGQTRTASSSFNNVRWNKIMDIQRDGLVLGTEDRHLLIYELRTTRTVLESHHRLPSTPDNIIVERKSPASFDHNSSLKSLTYKILVSCRNCRVYSLNQHYLVEKDKRAEVRELLVLKSNVLDMCWSGDDETLKIGGTCHSNFIVACLDRRVYCFNSYKGQCKWVVEADSHITSLISLPVPRVGPTDTQLIGVAVKAQRIDFYLSADGRIVDSIYLNEGYCQALTFGRFGREDNCLCATTSLGHLLIFILKRTAKFANAQCLSSAASYAAEVLSRSLPTVDSRAPVEGGTEAAETRKQLKLSEPANLPSAFTLTRSSMKNPVDQAVDLLQSDHNCDQVLAKSTLDAHMVSPQLQIPPKSRDFVDQIVEQSRHSTATSRNRCDQLKNNKLIRSLKSPAISRVFSRHMVKLRDKVRSTIEQQSDLKSGSDGEDGNKITLTRTIGLGNTYRVSLSLRLNLKKYAERYHHLLSEDTSGGSCNIASVFVFPADKKCQVKPFRFELQSESSTEARAQHWTFEKTIELKLKTHINSANQNSFRPQEVVPESESVYLEVYVLLGSCFSPDRSQEPTQNPDQLRRRPVFISSVSVPTC